MRFELRPLRWRDARQISRWRYPEPYAIYNLNTPDMLAALYCYPLWRLVGVAHFCAVCDERGAVVGMFQFLRQGRTVEVGLALRPDLTGQGLGLAFVRAGLAHGAGRFAPALFRLDVAAFNERARRVYVRAGFMVVRSLPKRVGNWTVEVLEMACPAADLRLAPALAHDDAGAN
jgi:ribosomal-protein-alanine N-acetyltransferase